MTTYLQELTLRLAATMAELPEAMRACHAQYLQAAQLPDGGFPGRAGEADLYYTSFALRGLSLLGALYGPPAEKATAFLRGRLDGRETVVDFLALVYGAMLLDVSAGLDVFAEAGPQWRDDVARKLEALRRDDGGYAKSHEGHASSTYHSFLVLLCLQLIGRPLSEPQRLYEFTMSQRCPDGGFREIRAAKRAGTNPTAAAVGVLRMLGAVEPEIRDSVIRFLAGMQTAEGGLRANTRIPIADLLSTFTGVLTLSDLDALTHIDCPAVWRYADSLQQPQGGFRGAAWDDTPDAEYTFYGLGCLALLHPLVSRAPSPVPAAQIERSVREAR